MTYNEWLDDLTFLRDCKSDAERAYDNERIALIVDEIAELLLLEPPH